MKRVAGWILVVMFSVFLFTACDQDTEEIFNNADTEIENATDDLVQLPPPPNG